MRWIALVVLGVFAAATCSADEVADAMERAREAYSRGDYRETSTELRSALSGVSEKIIELLMERMPTPPDGWQAGEPEGLDSGNYGMGFFAGLVVTRTYTTPQGSTIDLTIAADSPMLSTLLVFVSNPMLTQMGGESGMEKVSVCGNDAVEETEGTAAIHILAGASTLISVEGESPADIEDVRALASGVDCQGIVAIVE
ncbi:MAG: hypothetical protein GF400_03575 [Candidatus Eisenbacteria bacterium]|nr:hypothetical protein [Candidatus Eisenbacteria bacterium]